jgi:ComF family protein
MLEQAWQRLLETLFPARCLGCGLRGTSLCAECRADLPYLPEGVCGRCASVRTARGVCRGCRRLSPHLGTVRAAFAYEGPARNAVLTLKFRSGRYLVDVMTEFLREELSRRPLNVDVVVPVPLASGRRRQRGYNQAELLALPVASNLRADVRTDVLVRENRPPQQTLDAAARLVNLSGAIRCAAPDVVRGRRVLVVDDVITTGATVSACADTLAQAGATHVSALAFARDL